MAQDLSFINDIAKEAYPQTLVDELVMKNHFLLPMMQRSKKFSSRYLHVPIQYNKPQGRTHSGVSDAQSYRYASDYDAFQVTRVDDYAVCRLTGEIVEAAALGSAELFVDAFKAEYEGMLSTLGDNLAKEAYRSTSGSRGQVGSISGTTLSLKNTEDVVFFEVGMEIQADSVDGGGTVHSGSATITAINRDDGELTTDSNWTSQITGLAADDYLFAYGDYDAAAAGVAAWVPSTAPGATAFFGVDRSVDVERLGGIRFDGSNYTMEEVFIRAEARAARSGATVTHFFANPIDVANLKATLEGRKRVIDVETAYAGVGFKALKVCDGRAGEIPIVSDPDCPPGKCYGLNINKWFWATMGEAPRLVEADGLRIQRLSSSDVYEARGVARHNFYTPCPGGHMVITLPSS